MQCTEIFIGLIAPIGVDYSTAVDSLETRLLELGLAVEKIKLSSLIAALPQVEISIPSHEGERISSLMKAGNNARNRLNDGAALTKLAVLEVQKMRKEHSTEPNTPGRNTAYIFLTLKNPDEVRFLRETYGEAFVAISIYEPRSERVSSLSKRIATSRNSVDNESERAMAENLVRADEEDGQSLGQKVSDSYAIADFFVSTTTKDGAKLAIDRFTDILFGHPFHTPTVDEYGMFLAWGVSLRSADLSRQVGAAFCDMKGNLIAVGCNDVPKAGGGQYWPGSDDERDFQRGYDSSAFEKRRLLAEVLDKLEANAWLADDKKMLSMDERIESLIGRKDSILSKAAVNSLLEYGRIVHAEMAAIADAARRGLALQDCTLYTTTFPCHVCARHIVAAGVKRVVYIEPYPKSRAKDLHDDAIAVDSQTLIEGKVVFQSFNGIAPRRYGEMFQMTGRKSRDGKAIARTPSIDKLRIRSTPNYYIFQEISAAKSLDESLANLIEPQQDAATANVNAEHP